MTYSKHLLGSLLIWFSTIVAWGQVSEIWSPDLGNGTFKNPIIDADYSDPDLIRVGSDFYMISSSFHSVPALPILHSKDLINWRLVNHAIKSFPGTYYHTPQHGNGVWAPCIRYHQGKYYIYWGDPDQGIFMVHTQDPFGEWSAPVLVKKAIGNIDPSPLWDDDGKAYLVHAFANSRAGIKSVLQIHELSPDGGQVLDQGTIVFDGHQDHPTIEGPKLYKRNGYYYIFAPAGGVPTGWQLILRSKSIYGPYEEKIVLAQGSTSINGPHQGGWVELENGENWFAHFQDKEAYGRVVHLQPVQWINNWPVMGHDPDGDGTGEPYLVHTKPKLPVQKAVNPADTDEFDGSTLGLQWQWNAQPQYGWHQLGNSQLTLTAQPQPADMTNLWMMPNLLLQKFPGEDFQVTTQVDLSELRDNEEAGLLIFGLDYAAIAIRREKGTLHIRQTECRKADKLLPETVHQKVTLNTDKVWLQTTMLPGAQVHFAYSTDGKQYLSIGSEFTAREGKWVGAKVGLYAKTHNRTGIPGSVSFEYFRFSKP